MRLSMRRRDALDAAGGMVMFVILDAIGGIIGGGIIASAAASGILISIIAAETVSVQFIAVVLDESLHMCAASCLHNHTKVTTWLLSIKSCGC